MKIVLITWRSVCEISANVEAFAMFESKLARDKGSTLST